MYCPNCSEKNTSGTVFCVGCGWRFGGGKTDSETPVCMDSHGKNAKGEMSLAHKAMLERDDRLNSDIVNSFLP